MTYGAGNAIDMDHSTRSEAFSLESEDGPWIKISLGQLRCVEKVERYARYNEIWQTWNCSANKCTCVGHYCGNFYMTIRTEGAVSNQPPLSNCSNGDTVTYGRNTTNELRIYELVVFGREIQGIPGTY